MCGLEKGTIAQKASLSPLLAYGSPILSPDAPLLRRSANFSAPQKNVSFCCRYMMGIITCHYECNTYHGNRGKKTLPQVGGYGEKATLHHRVADEDPSAVRQSELPDPSAKNSSIWSWWALATSLARAVCSNSSRKRAACWSNFNKKKARRSGRLFLFQMEVPSP